MPSLTEHLVTLLDRPITRADRDRAALHLLDWLGCAVAGAAFRAYAARQQAGSRA